MEEQKKVDRRRFFETSMTTGIGLTLGRSSLGQFRQAEKKDDRIYRVGVVGSTGRGNFGHGLDSAWFDFPNCRIVGVADDNPTGLRKAVKRLKVDEEKGYSNYREMFEAVKPDIACICPRWIDQHRDMAVSAANRGIHVYMEKPFCRTLKEADEIVGAVENNGVKFALALWTHYSPKIQTVRKLIRDGAIGDVLEYRARGKEDHRGGGEDLWVLGIHMMDLIRSLANHPKWCFAQVTQNGHPISKRDIVDGKEGIGPLAGDTVNAMYGMEDNSTAYFSSIRNKEGDPWRFALQIFGSKGIIEIQEGTMPPVKYLPDPSWCPGRSGARWQDVSTAGIGEPEPLAGPEYQARHYLAINDLLSAIELNQRPICNVYEARAATEMIVAVFESQRVGKAVSLPLKNRENPLTLL